MFVNESTKTLASLLQGTLGGSTEYEARIMENNERQLLSHGFVRI